MDRAAVGWLRSPTFDLALIGGVLSLALVLGGVAAMRPELFAAVIAFDFWLLAYPHVASTYTRVAFDRASVREHRFLLFALPPIVLAATGAAAWAGGVVLLNTAYFYWQTQHYTMQSYGIARAYQRRARGDAPLRRDWLTDAVVFAFPIWGVLKRAYERPPAFYGSPLWSPPVPKALVVAAATFAFVVLAAWTWRELRATDARARSGMTLFVLSHVVITCVSYVVLADVTRGWLFINVWHNAQYILFVWAYNAREHRAGVDPKKRVLSWLSQPKHVVAYAGACLALATLFYVAIGQALPRLSWSALPIVMVFHLSVNFHHYLVDAFIWRTRPTSSPRGASP